MLFKNVFRTLKRQYVQLLLLGVIITLSSFIYTAMDYGVGGIKEPAEEYFEVANQEDFAISMKEITQTEDESFILSSCGLTVNDISLSAFRSIDSDCYYSLIDYRLGIFSNTYDDITMELREYKNVNYDLNGDSHKLRILKDNDTVNLSFFTKGVTPQNNTEIAIGETYANANNLDIGDKINVEGTDYTISGFVLFPDYSLAILSEVLVFDNKTQSLALLSDDSFEDITTPVGFHIGGVINNGLSNKDFESLVLDDYRTNDDIYFVTSILLTEMNMRSGAIYGEIEGGEASGLMLSILIASIAILIVAIMVSKILQSQRGAIGILKSMGYKNSEITLPYVFFIAILAFPALITGYFLGVIAAEPFKNAYLIFYLLPSGPITQSISTFVVAVVVPLSFITILGYIIINKILSQKPVVLLNPQVSSKANFFTKIMGRYLKKLRITRKLQHLLLYRNTVKFIVFLVGMFYAAFLILFSLSMVGLMDRTVIDYYDNTDHNYIGYCSFDSICEAPSGTQESVIEIPGVLMDKEEMYLVGLNTDSKIHKLYDSRDKNITSKLEDGLIITKSFSLVKGFKVGDDVLIEIGDRSVEIEVVGITTEYNGNKGYVNIDDLSILLTTNTGFHNVVYSETELDPLNYVTIISTSDIIEQTREMQVLFDMMMFVMIAVSIAIGAIVVYILTVMTIEDNFYNISLFKVIGYNNKEIDKMILGGYLLYGIIIFLITIPYAILAFWGLQLLMARTYNVVMPFEFSIWHSFVAIGIFVILFYLGAFVAKKKLSKISLQEAMKMYQI